MEEVFPITERRCFLLLFALLSSSFCFVSLFDSYRCFLKELWLCVYIGTYGYRHSLLSSKAGPRFDTSFDIPLGDFTENWLIF